MCIRVKGALLEIKLETQQGQQANASALLFWEGEEDPGLFNFLRAN